MNDLPISVAPDSALGQLRTALESTEAAVEQQRQVVSAASESYRKAEHRLKRILYSPQRPELPELERIQAEVVALQATRDLEAERLAKLIVKMRELQGQWYRDYTEFLRLQSVMADLRRLGG